jgi:hypothetical protein
LHDGYLYTIEDDDIDTKEDDGIKMCEYHVDDVYMSTDLPEPEEIGFGGSLSIS